MLLSEARTAVANLADDLEAVKYDETEIDQALASAQLQTWNHVVAHGGANNFAQQVTLVTTDGYADLSSIDPIKIVNVAELSAGSRRTILPASYMDAPRDFTGAISLQLAYVPRVAFPANASAAFSWSHANISAVQVYESLMLVIAASHLLIKEAFLNPALERRKQELMDAAKATVAIPSWQVLPLRSRPTRDSSYRYLMTAPDTLQLVYVI